MLNQIELRRLTGRFGAWGYGIYSRAEQLIQSNGGSCPYGELTASISADLCEKVETVSNMIRECELFNIEDNVATLKRSPRRAGALDPTEDQAFIDAWEAYGKKVNREMAFRAWKRLTKEEQDLATEHIPYYVEATPEIQYRPYLSTYLNQHRFLEPAVSRTGELIYDPSQKSEGTVTTPVLQGFQG